MDARTRRALAAIAEMDKRRVYLCPTCDGLLLTAAGRPLPMVCDEDGRMIDGEAYLNVMLGRTFADSVLG